MAKDIKELLEGLDSSIFTSELVESIVEAFNASVEEKVAKEKRYFKNLEKKLNKYSETSLSEAKAKLNSTLNRKVKVLEQKEALLKKQFDKKVKELVKEGVKAKKQLKKRELALVSENRRFKASLENKYAKKLSEAIKNNVTRLVKRSGNILESKLNLAKKSLMNECIKASMEISGTSISAVSLEGKERIKMLESENKKLKANLEGLQKESIVEKLTRGMSLVKKDNFIKVAENITFSGVQDFEKKLKALAQNMGDASTKKLDVGGAMISEKVEECSKDGVVDSSSIFGKYL